MSRATGDGRPSRPGRARPAGQPGHGEEHAGKLCRIIPAVSSRRMLAAGPHGTRTGRQSGAPEGSVRAVRAHSRLARYLSGSAEVSAATSALAAGGIGSSCHGGCPGERSATIGSGGKTACNRREMRKKSALAAASGCHPDCRAALIQIVALQLKRLDRKTREDTNEIPSDTTQLPCHDRRCRRCVGGSRHCACAKQGHRRHGVAGHAGRRLVHEPQASERIRGSFGHRHRARIHCRRHGRGKAGKRCQRPDQQGAWTCSSFFPIDSKAISSSVKRARDAGIPSMAFLRQVHADAKHQADVFVGIDAKYQQLSSARTVFEK